MRDTISPQQIQDLKKQGYSDNDINEALSDMEQDELNDDYNAGMYRGNNNQAPSSFGTARYDDVARIQLELNDILEKAEHTLRGDIVKFENGELIWSPNPYKENNIF